MVSRWLVGSLVLVGTQAVMAQPGATPPPPPPPPPPPQPAPQEPPLEQLESASTSDGAGYLGLVLYQDRAASFDDRALALVMGGEIQRLAHEFLFSKIGVELGGALDEGSETFAGFRYQLGALAGVGFGNNTGYVAVGTGLNLNGDVRGAVPSALSIPVELSYTTWAGSRLRASAWVRGDTFIAATRSRRDAADDVLVNELSAGARLTVITQQRQIRRDKVLRGLAVGFTVHRTMGSAVYLLQLGMGANTVPAAP